MSSKARLSLWITLGVVLTMCTLTGTALLSPWFLWQVAPASDIRILVRQSHPLAHGTSKILLSYLAPELQPYLNDVSTFVVGKKGDNITFIAYPKRVINRGTKGELARALTRDGWQVANTGFALIASDSLPPEGRAYHYLGRTILQMARHISDGRPLAVAEASANALPGYESQLGVLVTAHGDEVTVRTAEAVAQIPRAEESRGAVTPAGDLGFQLPGSVIKALPIQLRQDWNTRIISKLNFRYTKPDLFSTIVDYEAVSVNIGPEKIAFATKGNPESFLRVVTEALAAEEAYQHPSERSFQLPDGTIGREIVPGQQENRALPATGTCEERLGLWLCVGFKSAVIGQPREAVEGAFASDGWHVTVGKDYLGRLPLKLTAITATGNDTAATIRLKLAP